MIKRQPGERVALAISIFVTLVATFAILQISVWVFLILFIGQITYVLIVQKQLQGNSIRITEMQYTKLHKIIAESCEKLEMQPPHCYISFDPYINAYVLGLKRPYSLVLTSALVESLSDEEIRFVICHELGHIKMGHSRMKSFVMPVNNTIPIVTFIFHNWLRKTEYTADRVGLYASGDIKSCVNALKKIAVGSKLAENIDTKTLIKQVSEAYDENLEKMAEWLLTHPYITNRIRNLVEYYNFDLNTSKKV